MSGLLDWVDPTREWFKSRPEAAKGLLGAVYQMATDPQAREAAMARYPVFDRSQSGQQMMDNALNAGPSGLLGKIVYHGSPHKFDKFDASKIGTGEGAQAYGHGVYLADSPSVAQQYKADRSYVGASMRGAPVANDWGPEWIAKNAIDIHGDKATDHLGAILKQNERLKAAGQAEENKKVADAIELIKSGKVSPSGALYKADLPDEWIPKMLDWDKPLSQQSKEVQEAVKKARAAAGKTNEYWQPGKIVGGKLDYGMLGDSEQAAKLLREAGIPGIRYLDGGSRKIDGIDAVRNNLAEAQKKLSEWTASNHPAAKSQIEMYRDRISGLSNYLKELEGTSASYNYVVFPGLEDQVKILERNGVPISGLLGGAK